MKWINNKTILITGATNGIGKAAAIKFAESAKSIAFTYRNEELAEDLKVIIKEQIIKGKSDEDIKQFLVDKYGDWILMTPPFDPYTYVLWLSPAIIILFGFGYIYYKSRKQLK